MVQPSVEGMGKRQCLAEILPLEHLPQLRPGITHTECPLTRGKPLRHVIPSESLSLIVGSEHHDHPLRGGISVRILLKQSLGGFQTRVEHFVTANQVFVIPLFLLAEVGLVKVVAPSRPVPSCDLILTCHARRASQLFGSLLKRVDPGAGIKERLLKELSLVVSVGFCRLSATIDTGSLSKPLGITPEIFNGSLPIIQSREVFLKERVTLGAAPGDFIPSGLPTSDPRRASLTDSRDARFKALTLFEEPLLLRSKPLRADHPTGGDLFRRVLDPLTLCGVEVRGGFDLRDHGFALSRGQGADVIPHPVNRGALGLSQCLLKTGAHARR